MTTRIFEVCEIEWPSRYVKVGAHSVFSNFEAAEAYVKETWTPMYDRHMVIIETDMLDRWPAFIQDFTATGNILTYYSQNEKNVVKDI